VDLSGKRVLITGSTRGIGRCAAELFLAAGARVAVNGRTSASVAKAVAELRGQAVVAAPGDVSTETGCRQVVESALRDLGGLDCLVNNVGAYASTPMLNVTESDWDEAMNANVRSALLCAKAALPALRASKGSIVNVASFAALLAGPRPSFLYSVSKAGLLGLTRALAIETAANGVRVNCLCPGIVDTPGFGALIGASDSTFRETAVKVVPLGRLGTPRECASAMLYLASDDAAFFTASILVADGGTSTASGWIVGS
jgi:NAD(P)-dependent dehydrogenase (short-subunit alcohol dehydrogenase family)